MVKIACQSIVFSNSPLKGNLEEMARTVKKAGYDGLETGAGYFKDKLDSNNELFNEIGLKLAALHTGGDLINEQVFKDRIPDFKFNIEVAKKMGCSLLFFSTGWELKRNKEIYTTESGFLREVGKMCKGEGITFCYHNHAWEFDNNGEGYNILLDRVESEYMKLVPDVAWLEIAGLSSVEFIKKNIQRIASFHFKDFIKDAEGNHKFTELGNGLVPLKDVYSYITSIKDDWWVSAEQDRTDLDPAVAAKINCDYIAALRSGGAN